MTFEGLKLFPPVPSPEDAERIHADLCSLLADRPGLFRRHCRRRAGSVEVAGEILSL